jgi:hypothetical protein
VPSVEDPPGGTTGTSGEQTVVVDRLPLHRVSEVEVVMGRGAAILPESVSSSREPQDEAALVSGVKGMDLGRSPGSPRKD